ncbi:aromatic alcohol reductase [Aspergillus alliaceus]|uniref:aromatic alcohol reductase n=1 Tax=Petromyces alliaceus TaxID=209559 RepID=UPI0012A41E7F|nr:uncharacterized protein BDW43DRAFT_28211 [Aspergillus alliaceus]KAB8235838.1 hypothetical protein BDW43DRAFT_28211 [Aspergillus alliaceus]
MATTYAKDQPADFQNEIRHVAIIGAGGSVGKPITQALLKTGKHTITALTRANSLTTLPNTIHTIPVNYDDEPSLVSALTGQDALIITLPVMTAPDTQSKIVQAAAKAGVKYIMPNVWGCDVTDDALAKDIPNWDNVRGIFDEIEKTGVSSWIALICGFWYEHSLCLGPGGFGFDFAAKKLVLFDDGETKINISTHEQCGRAVARLLSLKVLPEDKSDGSLTLSRWLNKPVFISSFLISQKDMFESWKRVTGETEEDWTVVHESSSERYKKGLERMRKGEHAAFVQAMYSRVFFPNGGGDYEYKYGLANEALGLSEEGLDEHTKNAKGMVDRGYHYMTNRN